MFISFRPSTICSGLLISTLGAATFFPAVAHADPTAPECVELASRIAADIDYYWNNWDQNAVGYFLRVLPAQLIQLDECDGDVGTEYKCSVDIQPSCATASCECEGVMDCASMAWLCNLPGWNEDGFKCEKTTC